jgi:hypothetical protein
MPLPAFLGPSIGLAHASIAPKVCLADSDFLGEGGRRAIADLLVVGDVGLIQVARYRGGLDA